ncbi:hypothetical protein B0H10DRAFT_1188923 [Mycena sp. CBHHK59/15]|nr:hypothetical protein B0H10DRAFT_1188923 [Mycena sp. CBHHK59/15]
MKARTSRIVARFPHAHPFMAVPHRPPPGLLPTGFHRRSQSRRPSAADCVTPQVTIDPRRLLLYSCFPSPRPFQARAALYPQFPLKTRHTPEYRLGTPVQRLCILRCLPSATALPALDFLGVARALTLRCAAERPRVSNPSCGFTSRDEVAPRIVFDILVINKYSFASSYLSLSVF